MTNLPENIASIIEAALMVAGRPLNTTQLLKLFPDTPLDSTQIKAAIKQLQEFYQDRGIVLTEVASGWQFQAKVEFSSWLSKLWEERPPRYSRAFLETLALIAYKQPITRAEIEDVRGVTVSSNIVKTLLELEWIRIVGYREVAGKPALYGTTKQFLDYFNLKSLSELPDLAELQDLANQEAKLQVQLELAPNTETEEPQALDTTASTDE